MAAISRVYNGDDPFVFISYSHRDDKRVCQVANELIDEGYRVWYDDGIETATRFTDVIAEHVERCTSFIIFVSKLVFPPVYFVCVRDMTTYFFTVIRNEIFCA